MIFDSVRTQEIALETLDRIRATEFDESRPMGNVARSHLSQVIKLWLVGYCEESKDLLPKFYDWIDFAIVRNEEFGDSQNFYLMGLHQSAAIIKWMIGEDASCHWKQAQFFNKSIKIEDKVYSKKDFSIVRIDEYMAFSNFAEKYTEGMDEFELYRQPKKVGGKLDYGEFGYLACASSLNGQPEKGILFIAGKTMLRRCLQEKLIGSGQYINAAMWLKLVYKYQELEMLSPLQILLRAYDDMPDVVAPRFMHV